MHQIIFIKSYSKYYPEIDSKSVKKRSLVETYFSLFLGNRQKYHNIQNEVAQREIIEIIL